MNSSKKDNLSVPCQKTIWNIAIPIALANVSNTLLMVADGAMLGRYSTLSLAAVGMSTTILTLFQLFSMSLAVGLQSRLSKALGSTGDGQDASLYVHTGLFSSLLLGIVLMLVCRFTYPFLFRVLGADSYLTGEGIIYLQIMQFSVLGICLNTMIQTIHSAHARTVPVFWNSLLMTSVNLFLDYVLIYGRLGFPEWGIRGAAIGSIVSIGIGLFFIGGSFLIRRREFHLTGTFGVKQQYKAFKSSASLGSSAAVEWFLWMAGTFIISRFLVLSGGAATLAFYHIGMRIQRFFMMGTQGYSNAAITLVSRSLGSGRYDYVNEWNWKILRSAVLTGAVGFFMCVFFPFPILSIFMKSDAIASLSIVPLTMALMGLLIVLRSVNMIIASSLRSMGNLRFFFITLLISFVLNIALSRQFILNFGLGATGAFLAMAFDEIIRNFANIGRFRMSVSSKLNKGVS